MARKITIAVEDLSFNEFGRAIAFRNAHRCEEWIGEVRECEFYAGIDDGSSWSTVSATVTLPCYVVVRSIMNWDDAHGDGVDAITCWQSRDAALTELDRMQALAPHARMIEVFDFEDAPPVDYPAADFDEMCLREAAPAQVEVHLIPDLANIALGYL